MAFFDFLKRSNLNLEHKEAPRVHMQQTTPYHNRQDNYRSYAKEGYQQNAVVFKCVNEISQAAASISFKVYQGDVELEQHPLLTLLKKPNPIQAGNEYFQSLMRTFYYLVIVSLLVAPLAACQVSYTF